MERGRVQDQGRWPHSNNGQRSCANHDLDGTPGRRKREGTNGIQMKTSKHARTVREAFCDQKLYGVERDLREGQTGGAQGRGSALCHPGSRDLGIL